MICNNCGNNHYKNEPVYCINHVCLMRHSGTNRYYAMSYHQYYCRDGKLRDTAHNGGRTESYFTNEAAYYRSIEDFKECHPLEFKLVGAL